MALKLIYERLNVSGIVRSPTRSEILIVVAGLLRSRGNGFKSRSCLVTTEKILEFQSYCTINQRSTTNNQMGKTVSSVVKKTGLITFPVVVLATTNLVLNLLYPVSGTYATIGSQFFGT